MAIEDPGNGQLAAPVCADCGLGMDDQDNDTERGFLAAFGVCASCTPLWVIEGLYAQTRALLH